MTGETKSNKRRKTRRKPSPNRRTCTIPEAGEALGLSRESAYGAARAAGNLHAGDLVGGSSSRWRGSIRSCLKTRAHKNATAPSGGGTPAKIKRIRNAVL